jgi:hypothetical protein
LKHPRKIISNVERCRNTSGDNVNSCSQYEK